MPLPVNVKELLRQFGLHPRSSLGQNFLADDHVLARIAGAAELTPQDQVLEIGPGLGTLTRHLAERARRVVAVELDASLIPALRHTLASYPNIEIIHGDILQFPISNFQSPGYKVVANIPYNITSQILRHLLEADVKPGLIVLTVQLEVAQRITATPGQMSLLAVSVQLYGKPSIVGRIGAGAFYPPPKVDSAIVRIEPYGQPPVDAPDSNRFFAVVRAGFSQRRKQLHNALAAGLARPQAEVAAALERAGVDGRRRAETLSLEEWARLAHQISNT
jgi:16S rRNA (adenine1518-N6/adenine1519-N6)-dimethyltransferase